MGSVAKKGLQKYLLQLQHHPLRTKAITAAVLSGISDTVSQKLSGIPKLQLRRILLKMVKDPLFVLFLLFGFAYLGPFGHYMYMLLDKIFKGKRDSKTVAKKVVLEQLTTSPCNNLLFMIYYGVVVEGVSESTDDCMDGITLFPTLSTNRFWPVVGWINHQYVPLQFRVIFSSLVAFCWGIFLNLRARAMTLPKTALPKSN
ncbi:hypothetical protein Godav_008859 [Gossypium davidsonii]|uniref:Peroxisomal membrane protein PMP22 n=1 Tax=Gossypium davidsonii TaxID=34287 RepID=A0A7J8SC22_GOSDV|nr:hypothetical protein [Gossypium davidsonii]